MRAAAMIAPIAGRPARSRHRTLLRLLARPRSVVDEAITSVWRRSRVAHADIVWRGTASEPRFEIMFRHRYDGVGLPCRNTMGSPTPTSTWAIAPSTSTYFQ
jgi:hypothetical protein